MGRGTFAYPRTLIENPRHVLYSGRLRFKNYTKFKRRIEICVLYSSVTLIHEMTVCTLTLCIIGFLRNCIVDQDVANASQYKRHASRYMISELGPNAQSLTVGPARPTCIQTVLALVEN